MIGKIILGELNSFRLLLLLLLLLLEMRFNVTITISFTSRSAECHYTVAWMAKVRMVVVVVVSATQRSVHAAPAIGQNRESVIAVVTAVAVPAA